MNRIGQERDYTFQRGNSLDTSDIYGAQPRRLGMGVPKRLQEAAPATKQSNQSVDYSKPVSSRNLFPQEKPFSQQKQPEITPDTAYANSFSAFHGVERVEKEKVAEIHKQSISKVHSQPRMKKATVPMRESVGFEAAKARFYGEADPKKEFEVNKRKFFGSSRGLA